MRRVLLLIAVLLGIPSAGSGQPSASLAVGPGMDRYDTALAGTSTAPTISVDGTAELRFVSGRARIFYDVDVTTYAIAGDWRSAQHEIGTSYRVDLGARGTRRLFVGGSGVMRRNGASWGAADYLAASLFTNLEIATATGITMRAGYRADVRRFRDLSALDQTQHGAFGSLLLNLPTRTTVVAEVSAGLKSYAGAADATGPATAGEGSEEVMSGNGAGGGRTPGQRMSLDVVAGASPPGPSGDSDVRASAVTFYGRFAQSLAARTGVTLEATRRLTRGDVPAALVVTPPGFFDDGVYDDPFTSDSTSLRIGLKSVLTNDVVLAASGSWQDKPYRATPALDDTGTAIGTLTRHDRIARAGVSASWPLFATRTDVVELDLVTAYDFTRHRSTTSDYNYRAHAFGVGISVKY